MLWPAASGIVAAVIIGAILSLLPRHFRRSSRLILTVATIGLAQALDRRCRPSCRSCSATPATNASCTTAAAHQTFNTPLHTQFTIGPVVFSGNDIVAFVGTAIIAAALALFMRRSKYGLAIRAASENGERATLLGVSVPRLDTIIWVVAAVLSTVAILLQTPVLGFGGFQTVSTTARRRLDPDPGRGRDRPHGVDAPDRGGRPGHRHLRRRGDLDLLEHHLRRRDLGDRDHRGPAAPAKELQPGQRVGPVDLAGGGRGAADPAGPGVPPRGALDPAVVSRWRSSAVAILLPLMLSDSQTYLASIILIYAIVGLSLLVLTGWTGQISLGQFGIAGLAGAVSADLYSRHGWDFFAALARGGGGRGPGRPHHRGTGAADPRPVPGRHHAGLRHLRVRVSALAVLPRLAGDHVVASRPPIFGNTTLLSSDSDIYYFCLIGFFLCLMAVRSLRRSRIGRSLIATRDNEAAARATALNTTRQKLTAFLISGAIAGFAGCAVRRPTSRA